jgi:hypothetical protein
VRHYDVQSVGCATLKDNDQPLVAAPKAFGPVGRSRQEARQGRRSDDCQCAIAEKYASSDGHENSS